MQKILLFLALMEASLGLMAQASLEVVVTAPSGEALAGVEITLQRPDQGLSLVRRTNGQGKTVFGGLPAGGPYEVILPDGATYLGARSAGIELAANQAGSVTLLTGGTKTAETEVVDIVGNSTTRINTVNAEVRAELREAEVRNLPVEGRDITRALYRLPNVTQSTGFYPEAPNVAINGSNGLYTNYQIDGMDNNERFLGGQKFAIPVGMVRNITVLTNNYAAEHGLSANGVVNITTKSGSNDAHGEAYVLVRPGAIIDGTSPYAQFQRDLYGNPVKDGFQRYQGGFGVGGALAKDRTFYYLNVEQTVDLKDNLLTSPDLLGPGVAETIRGQNRMTYLSGRLDHWWNKRWRSTLRVHGGLVQLDRQGGGLEGGATFPSAASTQDRNSLLVASQNSYIGENSLAETNLQYSRFRWNYFNPVNGEAPGVTVFNPAGETIALLGRAGYLFDAIENTLQLQEKLTFYLGDHSLKTGINLISADHTLSRANNTLGNYQVQLTEGQLSELRARGLGSSLDYEDLPSDVQVLNYRVQLLSQPFGTRQTVFSAYVEDQWSVSNRLNLNLGLRYDLDDLSRGGSDRLDLNNLAPRFSANYRLNDHSSLRAGYGIFYDKITYAIYSDAIQFNSDAADYRAQVQQLVDLGQLPAGTDVDRLIAAGDLEASFPQVSYLQGPTATELLAGGNPREGLFGGERRILNPSGYQNPMAHQFTLGYQYQVNEQTLFSVDVFHNRAQHLLRLRDVNGPTPYPAANDPNGTARSLVATDATRPVPIFYDSSGQPYSLIGGDTLRGVARNVVMTESAGHGQYYAATFNLQRDRGDGPLAFRLIYTLSRLMNDTDGINFRAEDANDFEAEWGPSINDRTHVINGFVSWFPVDRLSLTLAALIQSGQPINRTPYPTAIVQGGDTLGYTVDLNGDGRLFGDGYTGNSDRYPGAGRNSDRLPWAYTFDLSAQYGLPLGPGELLFRADVFNVLNTANLSGYSNNATQSNQIQVGPPGSAIVFKNASPPRQFQFGVSYVF
ncbi:MAG: TonB-dependent receptor [Bacteroidetes bacterium]|nr:MAG: TonB-dependent receptor [Bacteroidota bacterium]